MEGKAVVGRKPRRAHDTFLFPASERAGFEPRSGGVLAKGAPGSDGQFAPIWGGFETLSRGSNPARIGSARWHSFGRAEIFALPILGSRLCPFP